MAEKYKETKADDRQMTPGEWEDYIDKHFDGVYVYSKNTEEELEETREAVRHFREHRDYYEAEFKHKRQNHKE